jgi:hypothetical protein
MSEDSEYIRKWRHMPKYPLGIDGLKSDIGVKIQLALKEKRCVDIIYHGREEPITSRRIEPIELFRRGNYHYTYAYCYLEEEMRYFRIDRIYQAKLTDQTAKHLYGKRLSVKRFYSFIRRFIPYILIAIFILIFFSYRTK